MRASARYLHIIAFDIPLPANYGGVIDIWYKIKALADDGVKIILHAYQYGREDHSELHTVCHKVYFYKRKTFRNPFYGRLPYITASRNSNELLENLLKDKHPILFEGLHCCYYLDHSALKNRVKIVRTHNIEHHYYKNLEAIETNFFKKYFFNVESERLKKFQDVLENANLVAAISEKDAQYFKGRFTNVQYVPPFHPNNSVKSITGRGKYCLYHGNLAVGENYKAAMFLITEVFSKTDIPLIIAGTRPPSSLSKAAAPFNNISIRDDLNSDEILSLIEEAHINVLPTFQDTGIKLKLINALFRGRFSLVNKKMVDGTGLEEQCERANTPTQFQNAIARLWKLEFDESMKTQRAEVLNQLFNNSANASRLNDLVVGLIPERVSEPAYQPE